eukprot:COSAG01_NODE_48220_length_383_cov_0.732394_1_plen_30_part_01
MGVVCLTCHSIRLAWLVLLFAAACGSDTSR